VLQIVMFLQKHANPIILEFRLQGARLPDEWAWAVKAR